MGEGPLSETRWPFGFVVNGAGEPTGWVVLHAPIQSPSRRELFARHRRFDSGFIGMTSFLTWPALGTDDPLDYDAVCEGWCHCFRDPDRYLPPGRPRTLLGWSDFTDPAAITPTLYASRGDFPRFDFVYVVADQPWKQEAKGWDLGRRCVTRLCRAGLRGLVIGAPPGTVAWTASLTLLPRLPYGVFLHVLARSRALFVPSRDDPSPRILAEALCLDVPIIVRRSILGGWKYVQSSTGSFFDGEDDVVDVALDVVQRDCSPRSWWLANEGPVRAGERLRALIEAVDSSLPSGGPLRLSYRATSPSDDQG